MTADHSGAGFDLAPGETKSVPLRPMTLGEIRSAIECDIFATDENWRIRARARFGWAPMGCKEALEWAKTPEGREVPADT